MQNNNEEILRTEGDINFSRNRDVWQENNLSEEAMELLHEDNDCYLHQSMSTPCLHVIEKSYGIYIEDMDGKKYMDFHGNSVHQVGYGNEYVLKAIQEQLLKLPFCPRRYTNKPAIKLAKKLTDIAPANLNKVLLAPGGTSAVSMALKLIRKVTGKFKTVSMWDSFHGASLDAISIGGEAVFRKDMGPLLPGCEHVMPYNSYRCIFGDCDRDCSMRCIEYLKYVIEREPDIGAVILEPIRCTDVQIPPKKYHHQIREICDRNNILLVYDEIPTALGRTGSMFAFEHYEVEPDIVLLGKGLGGGVFPLSAMLVRHDLDQANDISLGHFTHEKSPVGCAASLATIEYIEDNDLLQKTRQLGQLMFDRLKKMQAKYEIIGDVRGIGLLYGVELVENLQTKEKAITKAEKVMYTCLENGLSFKVSQGNVLTLTPPLIISEEELIRALDIIEKAIQINSEE